VGDTRDDESERCDDNDRTQRGLAKQRAKKMHYPIPVL
jgi:hypothetical protein